MLEFLVWIILTLVVVHLYRKEFIVVQVHRNYLSVDFIWWKGP